MASKPGAVFNPEDIEISPGAGDCAHCGQTGSLERCYIYDGMSIEVCQRCNSALSLLTMQGRRRIMKNDSTPYWGVDPGR